MGDELGETTPLTPVNGTGQQGPDAREPPGDAALGMVFAATSPAPPITVAQEIGCEKGSDLRNDYSPFLWTPGQTL